MFKKDVMDPHDFQELKSTVLREIIRLKSSNMTASSPPPYNRCHHPREIHDDHGPSTQRHRTQEGVTF